MLSYIITTVTGKKNKKIIVSWSPCTIKTLSQKLDTKYHRNVTIVKMKY